MYAFLVENGLGWVDVIWLRRVVDVTMPPRRRQPRGRAEGTASLVPETVVVVSSTGASSSSVPPPTTSLLCRKRKCTVHLLAVSPSTFPLVCLIMIAIAYCFRYKINRGQEVAAVEFYSHCLQP